MVLLRKLKPFYPSTSQDYNNCSASPFYFIQKIVSPIPIYKRGQKLHSISDITKERQYSYYHCI